uniref:Uncharacterized protein n=1 Tax=Coccidioides posadasii RMSCC 3488 TaxID=454284 RepID=A0A0J6FFP1_COCPO|nr:hypothetical protein CPAG_04022 [Coccidioides posadasii RMSCC 3488]
MLAFFFLCYVVLKEPELVTWSVSEQLDMLGASAEIYLPGIQLQDGRLDRFSDAVHHNDNARTGHGSKRAQRQHAVRGKAGNGPHGAHLQSPSSARGAPAAPPEWSERAHNHRSGISGRSLKYGGMTGANGSPGKPDARLGDPRTNFEGGIAVAKRGTG